MSIAETLLIDFDAEMANTRRLLERIPENDPQWKPHEKSMPVGRLALHVARLPDFWTRVATTDELEMQGAKFPPLVFESTAHLLSELDRSSKEAKEHTEKLSDEQLQEKWRLLFGGRSVFEGSRAQLFRTLFLNHLLHHRGQLTVYLRLLNVPVPGLYGPSADEGLS